MSDTWVTAGKIRQSIVTIRNVWPATITLVHRQMSDEPVTGSAVSPALVPTHILDARAECHGDLRFYTRLILEQVNDGTISTRVDATDVDQLAGFIDVWALLFSEQMPDDADQCAKDMRGHAEKMRGMIRGDQMHRYQVGRCPELLDVIVEKDAEGNWLRDADGNRAVEHEQMRCPGNLWASMRRQDAMLPQSIVCDVESAHTWAPWQWAALGKRLEVPA